MDIRSFLPCDFNKKLLLKLCKVSSGNSYFISCFEIVPSINISLETFIVHLLLYPKIAHSSATADPIPILIAFLGFFYPIQIAASPSKINIRLSIYYPLATIVSPLLYSSKLKAYAIRSL